MNMVKGLDLQSETFKVFVNLSIKTVVTKTGNDHKKSSMIINHQQTTTNGQ